MVLLLGSPMDSGKHQKAKQSSVSDAKILVPKALVSELLCPPTQARKILH